MSDAIEADLKVMADTARQFNDTSTEFANFNPRYADLGEAIPPPQESDLLPSLSSELGSLFGPAGAQRYMAGMITGPYQDAVNRRDSFASAVKHKLLDFGNAIRRFL